MWPTLGLVLPAIGFVNKLTPQIPVFFIATPFVIAGGLIALAAVAQNWGLRQNTPVERGLLLLSGLLLVFPSLIEAIVEWIIGRDISYTYVPGLIIGLGVLLWQARTPAPKRPAVTI
jgi:hypothetical protein